MIFLQSLAERVPVERVALVVAHPDDETLALGGLFHCVPGLLLVHVTDGAPRGLPDAARYGGPAAYGALRAAELDRALAVAAVPGLRRVALGIPDQDATLHIGTIATSLANLFDRHGIQTVVTHAYEGGHPDHDAVACAVQGAAGSCDLVAFAGYNAGTGSFGTAFLPGAPVTTLPLSAPEQAERRAMLDCFASQAEILSRFDDSHVQFRPAPAYDFTQAPHEGPLNYETWGWPMTGARFRELAREALSGFDAAGKPPAGSGALHHRRTETPGRAEAHPVRSVAIPR